MTELREKAASNPASGAGGRRFESSRSDQLLGSFRYLLRPVSRPDTPQVPAPFPALQQEG
jgi:hypothetical protein